MEAMASPSGVASASINVFGLLHLPPNAGDGLDPEASPERNAPSLAAVAVPVAVFGVFADMLDRDHMLVLGGVEHDHALGGAAGDPDALDRTADQLALVGHQHDLVAVLDRERCHQLAVAVIDRHRHDAFAAAAGGAVFIGRGALAVAVHRHRQHYLFLRRHLDIAFGTELDRARCLLGFDFRGFFGRGLAGHRPAHLL